MSRCPPPKPQHARSSRTLARRKLTNRCRRKHGLSDELHRAREKHHPCGAVTQLVRATGDEIDAEAALRGLRREQVRIPSLELIVPRRQRELLLAPALLLRSSVDREPRRDQIEDPHQRE